MIKDWHLMVAALLIVTVDLIFLVILIPDIVTGNIVTQEKTGETIINVRNYWCTNMHSWQCYVIMRYSISIQSQEVTAYLVINRCDDTIYFMVFIGLSLAYKLILHAVALVLACLIRKVHIEVLNDSRETRSLIYVLTATLVVYFTVLYTLYDNRSLVETARAIVIFMGSMTILGLIFVPKVYHTFTF